MSIKAALFDLDGTLLDTQRLYDEVNQQLINEYGNKKKYDFESQKNVIGCPANVVNKYLLEKFEVKLSSENYSKLKNEYLIEPLKNCDPMKGSKEITKNLKNKYGLKLAVCTSSPKSLWDIKINKHKEWFKNDFDLIITGDDKRIKKGKPNPDIFLLAANELGVKPEECIIFEDAVNGVEAGLNSEAKIVVAIPNSYFIKTIEELKYDKNKTKLCILNSLDDFDYSLLK